MLLGELVDNFGFKSARKFDTDYTREQAVDGSIVGELWHEVVNHPLGQVHGGIDKFTWPYGIPSDLDFSSLPAEAQAEVGKEWLLLTW